LSRDENLRGAKAIEIRYILPADDKMAVSKVYEESWKFAYKGLIPQDWLDSIPGGRWASGLERSGWDTLVCLDRGRIVGTGSFCKSRFEAFPDWGEVISLYLLPEYMGKGYGKILLESVVLELKKRGFENIFLWVLEENRRARHFYEKFGFLPTGDFLEDSIGGKDLREVRYIYKSRNFCPDLPSK